MFKVRLHGRAFSEKRDYSLMKDIELPFVPFVGLEIEVVDFDEAYSKIEALNPDGDPMYPFDVAKVSWNATHQRFELQSTETRHRDGCCWNLGQRIEDDYLSERLKVITEVYGFTATRNDLHGTEENGKLV